MIHSAFSDNESLEVSLRLSKCEMGSCALAKPTEDLVSMLLNSQQKEDPSLPIGSVPWDLDASTKNKSDFLFEHCVTIDDTWTRIKAVGCEQKLGDQIVLGMMEMDPRATSKMGIAESNVSRCPRFREVSETLVALIDLIVSLLGPNLGFDGEAFVYLGEQFQENGVQITLFSAVVPEAMRQTLEEAGIDFSSQDQDAWEMVLHSVARKMFAAS